MTLKQSQLSKLLKASWTNQFHFFMIAIDMSAKMSNIFWTTQFHKKWRMANITKTSVIFYIWELFLENIQN